VQRIATLFLSTQRLKHSPIGRGLLSRHKPTGSLHPRSLSFLNWLLDEAPPFSRRFATIRSRSMCFKWNYGGRRDSSSRGQGSFPGRAPSQRQFSSRRLHKVASSDFPFRHSLSTRLVQEPLGIILFLPPCSLSLPSPITRL